MEIKNKIDTIVNDIDNTINNITNGSKEEKVAFLKGVFLSSGSINDPKTSRYHLEFMIDDNKYAKFLNNLLNKNDLNSKIIKREKNFMVYIKI